MDGSLTGSVCSHCSLLGGICGFQDALSLRTDTTNIAEVWALVGWLRSCSYVGLIQNLLRCHWKSSRALNGALTFCRSAFPASAVLQNGSSATDLAGSLSLLLLHSDCIESYLGWLKV